MLSKLEKRRQQRELTHVPPYIVNSAGGDAEQPDYYYEGAI